MTKADAPPNLTAKAAEATLKSLGVAPTFFDDLLKKGDDWTFVIKSHALLEAALIHLLLIELERPELADVLSKLETSDTRTGKIALVKALKLLDEHHRRFIRTLSELRNGLIHDVRNTSFSFVPVLFGLGASVSKEIEKKAEKCVNSASEFFKETFELDGKKLTRRQFSKENPRFVIYFALYFLLADVYHQIGGEDPLVRALIKARRRQPNPLVQPTGQQRPAAD